MSFSTPDYRAEYDGILPVDVITHDILPSEGVRRAGLTGWGMGGTMLSPLTYHEIGFDSNMERRWIFQLLQCVDVVSIQEQPIETTYFDRNGDFRKTVWDLLITKVDGTRELISVKRLEVAENPGFAADFKLMADAVPAGVADKAWLATEYNLEPALVDRGELYQYALRAGKPSNAQAALAFIVAHDRGVAIQTVCDSLRKGAEPIAPLEHFNALSDDFWTVVWLLATRQVHPVNDDYLDVNSEVIAA